MDAITNLISRNSPRELTTPIPSKNQMDTVYQAALRAPDHAWLRPSRFIEVTGKGLDKLSDLFSEYSMKDIEDVTPIQLEKYKSAPYRAPMVIVLITKISEHPKVPEIEQIISAGAAAQNMLNAAYALGLGAVWRTGEVAYDLNFSAGLGLAASEKIIGFLYLGTIPDGREANASKINTNDYFKDWP